MKLRGTLACVVFVGCGAAPSGPATSMTNNSAASVYVPTSQQDPNAHKTEAAKVAESPAKDERASLDVAAEPLPMIVFTPPTELRANTRAKLDGALKAIKGQTTAAGVAAVLTRLLGKPTWIEDERTRVWVATDTTQCVRLVLQGDGSVDHEAMRSTESKSLSRTARQNLCSGQVEQVE